MFTCQLKKLIDAGSHAPRSADGGSRIALFPKGEALAALFFHGHVVLWQCLRVQRRTSMASEFVLSLELRNQTFTRARQVPWTRPIPRNFRRAQVACTLTSDVEISTIHRRIGLSAT